MRDLPKLQKLSHQLLNERQVHSDIDLLKKLFNPKNGRRKGYDGYIESDKLRIWKASGSSTIFTLELEDDERVYSSRMHPAFRIIFLLLWVTAITLATINYKFLLETWSIAIGYTVLFSVIYLLVSLIYTSARGLEFDALKIYVYQVMENMKAEENGEVPPFEIVNFEPKKDPPSKLKQRISVAVFIVLAVLWVLLQLFKDEIVAKP